jgi:hypothetical protein
MPRQYVDELSLPFVAPLRAHNNEATDVAF